LTVSLLGLNVGRKQSVAQLFASPVSPPSLSLFFMLSLLEVAILVQDELIRKTLLVRVVLSPILPFVVAMYRVVLCLR
jgi:hypothetical protein